MAYSMTVLSWGGISYAAGYQRAGMMEYLLEAVKWGTDYFLKAHTADKELYGQVGNGYLDHQYWGRPEEMPDDRPSYKINATAPGSDLAAETAAALAAASILFQGKS